MDWEKIKKERYDNFVTTIEYYSYMVSQNIDYKLSETQYKQLSDVVNKLYSFGEEGEEWAKIGEDILKKHYSNGTEFDMNIDELKEFVRKVTKNVLKEMVNDVVYYIVDDGGIYNVISSEDFNSKGRYIHDLSYGIEDFDIVKKTTNFDYAWKICDKLNGEDKIDESKINEDIENDGFEKVDWGSNIESLVNRLKEIFNDVIASEPDEFGIRVTPFDDLINHLKYYYDKERFDSQCFNAISKIMEDYDFMQDAEVRDIIIKLKKYI